MDEKQDAAPDEPEPRDVTEQGVTAKAEIRASPR